MKKSLFLIAITITAAALFFSCRRDLSFQKQKSPLTQARIWFNRQFDASLTVKNGELTGGNKYPLWQYASQYQYGNLQVTDVPLVFKKRAVYAAKNANGNQSGTADASLTKLLIARNAAGDYREAVMDIVPDKDFYATRYDLNKITLNNIPANFNGYILVRNWGDKKITGFRFTNGRGVKKLLPPGTRPTGPGPAINASVAQISFGMFCFDCAWQLGSADNVMSQQCQDVAVSCGLDMWDTEFTDPCSINLVNIFGCPCQDGIIDYDHCGFDGGGGGGGGTGGGYNPNQADNITIDTSISNNFPCLDSLLQELPNTNAATQVLLKNVFNLNTRVNLHYSIDWSMDSLTADDAFTPIGTGYKIPVGTDTVHVFNDTIFLNPYTIIWAAKEYLAGVLYHESIHAFIHYRYNQYFAHVIDSNQLKQELPIFWNYLNFYEAQHEQMAAQYVGQISNYVKLNFNPLTSEDLKNRLSNSIAWGGLEKSTLWTHSSGLDTCRINADNIGARNTTKIFTYNTPQCGNIISRYDSLGLSLPCF